MMLPPGYHLELVASEPLIVEPVTLAWDGNGRMYVAQMRTYMQDLEGSKEHEPTSCVSLLKDRNGDGKMDEATIFADKLVLPRLLLPLDDRILIAETSKDQLVSYRDTNGDELATAADDAGDDGDGTESKRFCAVGADARRCGADVLFFGGNGATGVWVSNPPGLRKAQSFWRTGRGVYGAVASDGYARCSGWAGTIAAR